MENIIDIAFPDRNTDVNLQQMFKIYETAKNNKPDGIRIFHKHHIVPKIWFKRNHLTVDNSPNNIVLLTVEQHIIVHYLLMKYFESKCEDYLKVCMAGAVLVISKGNIKDITQLLISSGLSDFNINISDIESAYRQSYKNGAATLKAWRDSVDPEYWVAQGKRTREWWDGLSEKEKEDMRAARKKEWDNLPEEEKQRRQNELRRHYNEYFQSLSPAEIKEIFGTHRGKYNTNGEYDERYAKVSATQKKKWAAKSDEEKAMHREKCRKAIMDMDPVKQEQMRIKGTAGKMKNWMQKSDEERAKITQPLKDGARRWWSQFTPEQRSEIRRKSAANRGTRLVHHQIKGIELRIPSKDFDRYYEMGYRKGPLSRQSHAYKNKKADQ